MTLYIEALGPFPAWDGEPIGGVTYQRNIEQLWSATELEAIGAWRDDMITPPAPVPVGKRVVTTYVDRVDGDVCFIHVLEDIDLAARQAARLAELAKRRWEIETGGVVIGDLMVPSDRETQSRVAQIVAAYDKGFVTGPVLFKISAGVHVEIDEATIRAIMAAGAVLIQSCFRREGELAGEILAAANLTDLEAVNVQGFWA